MQEITNESISNIIDRITQIRNFLGEDVFNVTDKASSAYTDNAVNLEKVIKEMSGLSSEIVKLVFNTKAQKGNLTDGDLVAINKVGLLAPKLGAAERKLYDVKKQMEIVNDESMKLTNMGMDFAETLMDLQDLSRSVITEFRHAGRDVPPSDLQTFMQVPKD